MHLYISIFRADIAFGDKKKTDHEVIVFASDEKEATERAERYFTQRGGYAPGWVPNGFGGMTQVAGTTPRLIETRLLPDSVVVYDGKVDESFEST
jgi:hypothetical protein